MLCDLNAKREKVQCKLEELKSCSSEAWQEMSKGLDRSWTELKVAFDELKAASEKAAAKFES
jgi:peptidoglycan hydrolase CwlO-like protein